MLHRLKVSLANAGDGGSGNNGQNNAPPGCSERFMAADDAIRTLMQEYPALQERVEHTERAFTTMTYAIRTTAASISRVIPEDSHLELPSAALVKAGESMPCPRGGRAAGALRAYCDEIRKARIAQSGAQDALRDRVYYAKKVNELSRAGGSDAIASKRVRNERKLAEADADLEIRAEQIEMEVARLLKKREAVLSVTMGLYIEQLAIWFDSTKSFRDISASELIPFQRYLSEASSSSVAKSGSTVELHERMSDRADDDRDEDEDKLVRFHSAKTHFNS